VNPTTRVEKMPYLTRETSQLER